MIAGEHGDVVPDRPATGSPPEYRAAIARRRRTVPGRTRPSRRSPAARPAPRHPQSPRSVSAPFRIHARPGTADSPARSESPMDSGGRRRRARARPGPRRSRHRRVAAVSDLTNSQMARDRACGAAEASLAARPRMIASSPGSSASKCETAATPVVSVPVLSKRIAATSARRSSASPPRNRTRRPAALPSALQTASGAASPRAHGQAINPTARPAQSPRSSEPDAQWTTKAITAIAATVGANTPAARSASR